jgi:cobalt-zinc-cadmium efflux system outer membrane protein
MSMFLRRAAAAACLLIAVPVPAQAPPAAATRVVDPVDHPALVRLVRQALEQHPQVLAAEAGLAAGEALHEAAKRPVFNPELEADLVSSDTSDRLVALSQTIDRAGLRAARTALAERQRSVAAQGLAAVRRDIALELLSALAEYSTARQLDALGEVRVDLMQRFARTALQRREAGDLTRVDLNVANLAWSQARMKRAEAAAALAEVDQTLRALTGPQSTAAWPRLPAALPAVQLGDDDVAELVAGLPEMRARRDLLTAADATVTLRERERRPNPTLSILGGREDDESLIGLSLSFPLNVRNRFSHEVAAARASRLQAEREADDVTARSSAALRGALQRYALTREAWHEWLDSGAPNLSEQTALLERLWRTGDLGLTEYLVQLEQTLDTQASAIELQRALWLAWCEWLAAAGRIGSWLGIPVEAS